MLDTGTAILLRLHLDDYPGADPRDWLIGLGRRLPALPEPDHLAGLIGRARLGDTRAFTELNRAAQTTPEAVTAVLCGDRWQVDVVLMLRDQCLAAVAAPVTRETADAAARGVAALLRGT